MLNKWYRILPYVAVLILAVLAITWPFFHDGYFVTDDGLWSVIRLWEMVRELKDGQFPPRWSDFLNHGFGYPLFSFTYPFPSILGAGLKFVGLSSVTAVKSLFVLSVAASGIFMFILARVFTGNFGGLIASLFYISSPYLLHDLYTRGSLGEVMAFPLFPLLTYLALKYSQKPTIFLSSLQSVILAVLFLTHNVMALLFFPVWLVFAVFLSRSGKSDWKKKLFMYLLIGLQGFGLASYFLIPVFLEKKYLLLSVMPLADKSRNFLELQGIINFLNWPVIVSILLSFFIYKSAVSIKGKIAVSMYIASLTVFFLGIFLTAKVSLFLWNFPVISSVDFPWRATALAVFSSSVIASFLALNKKTLIVALVFAGMNLIMNFSGIPPIVFTQFDESFFFTNDATTTSKDELMPVWVKVKPEKRYIGKVEIENGKGLVSDVVYSSKDLSFNIQSETGGTAKINTVYFPGWKFEQNGRQMDFRISDPEGLILIDYPDGKNKIRGVFTETPVRIFADIISVFALLILIVRLAYAKKK